MTVVVLNQGEEALLDNGLTGVAYQLRLYVNNVTAGLTAAQIDALDETDFTEATFPGYAAQAVASGDWTVTVGDPTEAVNTQKSFVRSSTGTPQTVRGYYVTRTSDGAAIWFEAFDGPVVVENNADQINVTPTITLDDAEGNAVQTGTITAYGGATAPAGWLLCNGAAVSRTTFAALFAIIGTAFGNGDGSTTFNVPDLRQRFPLGKADAGTGSTLGGTGGAIDHVHGLATSSSAALITVTAAAGNGVRTRRKTVPSYNSTHETTTATGTTAAAANTTATELTGDTAAANPPYQVVRFIIRT